MNYKLKLLGTCLVAVLALSLAATSIAAAAQFTSTSYPTAYKASGSSAYGYVTTEAGNIECGSASSSATLSAASSTLTLEGTASECKAFGFLSTSVSANGCTILVHVKEQTGTDTYSATVDLLCPAGKAVTTVAGTCETQTPPQNGSATVKMTDDTENGSVRVDLINVSAKYTVTKDGIGCPYNGTGEKTGGTFTQLKPGVISIKGQKVDVG